MIKMDPMNEGIAMLSCDVCQVEVEVLRAGKGIALPHGWRRCVWVPGILQPHGRVKSKPDLHLCPDHVHAPDQEEPEEVDVDVH